MKAPSDDWFIARLIPCQTGLYRFIARSVPSHAGAEEVFQQTNLVAWQTRASFNGDDIFAWLCEIAARQIRLHVAEVPRRAPTQPVHLATDGSLAPAS